MHACCFYADLSSAVLHIAKVAKVLRISDLFKFVFLKFDFPSYIHPHLQRRVVFRGIRIAFLWFNDCACARCKVRYCGYHTLASFVRACHERAVISIYALCRV